MKRALNLFELRVGSLLIAYTNILVILNIFFASLTPLMGDDFGGVFTGFNYRSLNMGVVEIFRETFSLVQDGSHVNFIGQLISVFWFKIIMTLALNFGLPITYFYVLLKIILYTILIKLIQVTYSKIYPLSQFNPFLLSLSFLLYFQIRAAWSNDPLTSFPFAGIFVGITILINIIVFHKIIDSRGSYKYLLLIILNYLTFLVYEINFAVFAYQTVWLILHLKKRSIPIQSKILFTLSILISVLLVAYTLINLGSKKSAYAGTSFSENGILQFGKTFGTTLFSLSPIFSWPKSYQLLMNGWEERLLAFLLVLLVIWVIILTVSGLKTPGVFLQNKRMSLNEYMPVLPLAAMSLSAIAIQSLTLKVQNDIRSPSQVYTYLVPLLLLGIIGTSKFLSGFINIMGSGRVLITLIICVTIQTTFNFGINQILWKEYSSNTKLLNSLTSNSTNESRCTVLADWNRRTWPTYYRSQVNKGVDFYSDLEFKNQFCNKTKY
jgi:hypothetical protein